MTLISLFSAQPQFKILASQSPLSSRWLWHRRDFSFLLHLIIVFSPPILMRSLKVNEAQVLLLEEERRGGETILQL